MIKKMKSRLKYPGRGPYVNQVADAYLCRFICAHTPCLDDSYPGDERGLEVLPDVLFTFNLSQLRSRRCTLDRPLQGGREGSTAGLAQTELGGRYVPFTLYT